MTATNQAEESRCGQDVPLRLRLEIFRIVDRHIAAAQEEVANLMFRRLVKHHLPRTDDTGAP